MTVGELWQNEEFIDEYHKARKILLRRSNVSDVYIIEEYRDVTDKHNFSYTFLPMRILMHILYKSIRYRLMNLYYSITRFFK